MYKQVLHIHTNLLYVTPKNETIYTNWRKFPFKFLFKFLYLYPYYYRLIHPLSVMHEVSTRVPFQLLISLIVTTIPMVITPIVILILVLMRPIVSTWLVVPRIHDWRLLRFLCLNLHKVTVVLRVTILELLLAFLYKLRLFACQSDICHGYPIIRNISHFRSI